MASAAAGWSGPVGSGRHAAWHGSQGRRTRPGSSGRAAGAGWIAQGHSISMRSVHEKLAAFDMLSMPGVLAAAKDAQVGVQEYEDSIDKVYLVDVEASARYKAAQARKDWRVSDRLFLDKLAQHSVKYRKLLNAEETVRAFSAWLCGTALNRDYVYRWIDPPEIQSCMGGTFKSKIEADDTRRGFKALTVNPGLWFGGRRIRMRVPMDSVMRMSTWCVRYTVLPRNIGERDERICDPKSAKNAIESEVRVPDGTPIPPTTDFAVLPRAGISEDVVKALGARYSIRRLGS